MGKLLEAFKILCSDFDHIWGKRGKLFKGDIFQGRILITEIRYILQWFIFRWSWKTQRHWCCEFTLSNGQMCQTHSKIYINGCCRLCSPLGQAICFFSNSEFQNVEFFKNSGGGISIRIPWPYAFAIKNSWYLSKDEKSPKLFKISCWKGRWQWNSSRILW